jgi:hypothetical protein
MSDEFPWFNICKNGHSYRGAKMDSPCLQCKIDELLKFRDDSAKASAALCAERIADREALKAENARLSEVAAAEMKLREGNFDTITQLEAENARLREVLENVQHGTVCPAQPGWLDAGPCTCGLDAALSAVPSDSPADVKTAPQMDLTKPVPTKAGSASATNTAAQKDVST